MSFKTRWKEFFRSSHSSSDEEDDKLERPKMWKWLFVTAILITLLNFLGPIFAWGQIETASSVKGGFFTQIASMNNWTINMVVWRGLTMIYASVFLWSYWYNRGAHNSPWLKYALYLEDGEKADKWDNVRYHGLLIVIPIGILLVSYLLSLVVLGILVTLLGFLWPAIPFGYSGIKSFSAVLFTCAILGIYLHLFWTLYRDEIRVSIKAQNPDEPEEEVPAEEQTAEEEPPVESAAGGAPENNETPDTPAEDKDAPTHTDDQPETAESPEADKAPEDNAAGSDVKKSDDDGSAQQD
jgi:hypothetical protein